MHTEKDGAVFYSGNANRNLAEQWCKRQGNEHCKTLEMTPGGNWLERQRLYEVLPKEQAFRLWKNLSERFANNASGKAQSFVQSGTAENRIWKSTEEKTLRANPKITRITYREQIAPGCEIVHHQSLLRLSSDYQKGSEQDLTTRQKLARGARSRSRTARGHIKDKGGQEHER